MEKDNPPPPLTILSYISKRESRRATPIYKNLKPMVDNVTTSNNVN